MKQFFGKKSRSALSLVLLGSLAVHLVGILIFGTIKFVSEVLREETVFEAAPIAPPPQKEPEYTDNIQQRNQSTPPPRPPAIVVNNPSELDIPALDIDVNVDSSSVYGRSGGGFGGDLAGVREMALDFKLTDSGYTGQVEGTLKGTLFDTKVDPRGKALLTEQQINDRNFLMQRMTGISKEFTAGNWSLRALERKYFKADDLIVVRVGSDIVVDGSYYNNGSNWKGSTGKGPPLLGLGGFPPQYGNWMRWEVGKSMDIKVLIGEAPGGVFGCCLLYQKKGEDQLRVFSTKPLTTQEKRILKGIHPDVSDWL